MLISKLWPVSVDCDLDECLCHQRSKSAVSPCFQLTPPQTHQAAGTVGVKAGSVLYTAVQHRSGV